MPLDTRTGPGREAGGAADGWGLVEVRGAQGPPQREETELLEHSGDKGEFGGPEKRPLHQTRKNQWRVRVTCVETQRVSGKLDFRFSGHGLGVRVRVRVRG